MSKLYKNVVVLDSGAGFFALLVAARTPEVPGAAQFQLMELLQSLAQQGRTVVMVLHDLAHAMQWVYSQTENLPPLRSPPNCMSRRSGRKRFR